MICTLILIGSVYINTCNVQHIKPYNGWGSEKCLIQFIQRDYITVTESCDIIAKKLNKPKETK